MEENNKIRIAASSGETHARHSHLENALITLYDYLPSQNGYKIRLALSQLGIPYQSEEISIFQGHGKSDAYLAVNPTGAVPAVKLDDGRVISESNAILWYLAEGTRLLPDDRYLRAKVAQWLSFEADYVQMTIGTLRYWTLTGKREKRPAAVVEGKVKGSHKALRILDNHFSGSPFLVGNEYSIADISAFAYSHLAEDAGISLSMYPSFLAWVSRVKSQPDFVWTIYPYSIDPHSVGELP